MAIALGTSYHVFHESQYELCNNSLVLCSKFSITMIKHKPKINWAFLTYENLR